MAAEVRGKNEIRKELKIFGNVKILLEDSLLRISENFEVGRAVKKINNGFSLACLYLLICYHTNNKSKENNLGLWKDYFHGGLR